MARSRWILRSIMAAAAGLAGGTAHAADAALIDAAKKEGEVVWYSTQIISQLVRPVSAAFEKKYGVKVRVWRGSSENVVQRSVTEARGGRYDADVIETGGAAMESLHRENLLQKVKPPSQADLDLSRAAALLKD